MPGEIRTKITNAFCPEKTIEFNPIIDICKHIVFRETKTFCIERPAKFGGTTEFNSFKELVKVYRDGKLHPLDLKKAVAEELIEILAPVRRYFSTNKEAREGLEIVRNAQVTR